MTTDQSNTQMAIKIEVHHAKATQIKIIHHKTEIALILEIVIDTDTVPNLETYHSKDTLVL